jgi:DNA-binding MarR family transcriptional regulator
MKLKRHTKIEDRAEPPFAYVGLDRLIHERARLSVLTSLAAHPRGLKFSDLKHLSGLTDGNLSRHLQVLVAGKLVAIDKSFEGNRPQTFCHLTPSGRKRYADYVLVLEQVVRDAAAAVKGPGRRRTSEWRPERAES